MKPIHKFNNGDGATLCHSCGVIVTYGMTNDLFCYDCQEELFALKGLVGELLDMLETVEISDNENEFHPTVIRSCRVQHTMRLNEIMPKITEIVRKRE